MDKYTKRGNDGSIDVLASATAYAEALTQWIAENPEVPTERIEGAVESVFDRFNGRTLTTPVLLDFTLTALGATPDDHKALSKRTHDYVKGQVKLGRLAVKNGVGGGISRLAKPGEPIPEKPAKPEK